MKASPRRGAAYYVEHRSPTGTTRLADEIIFLPPVTAALEAAGATGEVVLVDAVTDQVVIRYPLRRPAAGDRGGAAAADDPS